MFCDNQILEALSSSIDTNQNGLPTSTASLGHVPTGAFGGFEQNHTSNSIQHLAQQLSQAQSMQSHAQAAPQVILTLFLDQAKASVSIEH